MTVDLWIWPVRWADFQHYTPERDRAPAWIKTYPKQLDDWRYLDLSDGARSLLSDVRLMSATSHCQVRLDPVAIGRRRGRRTRERHLQELVQAGFLEIISRATLEQRLEQLYASRAPARSRREFSKENSREAASASPENGARSRPEKTPCPECGIGGGRHLAGCSLAAQLEAIAELGVELEEMPE